MQLWQLLTVIGIVFIILEMFTPGMFFLNFSLSAFICAILSLYVKNAYTLVFAFFLFSFISFIFLRPIIIKKMNKSNETGINSKYIGKTVIVDVDITEDSGYINIYGERWDARSENGELIPAGSTVKIMRNESIIMYVIKISD